MPPSLRRYRVPGVLFAIITFTILYLQRTNPTLSWPMSGSPSSPIANAGNNQLHWAPHPEKYPITSYIPLPDGAPVSIPLIQAAARVETKDGNAERLRRLAAVKESFVHSWNGYKARAWLRDEVAPVSGGYRDTFGGWAATLVDTLDTLWIMELKDEFEMAVKASEEIDFTTTTETSINVFETTIRYMGGFLAAYDISGGEYPVLLKKAVEVGELLYSVFDTPNRMPVCRWDWQRYVNVFYLFLNLSFVVGLQELYSHHMTTPQYQRQLPDFSTTYYDPYSLHNSLHT